MKRNSCPSLVLDAFASSESLLDMNSFSSILLVNSQMKKKTSTCLRSTAQEVFFLQYSGTGEVVLSYSEHPELVAQIEEQYTDGRRAPSEYRYVF